MSLRPKSEHIPQGDNRHTILIVDDDPDTLGLLKRVVERDYRALTAVSGQEALTILNEMPVDTVLLDVMMPGMNGLETLTEIRKRTRTLPVILVSALSDKQYIVDGLESGANDYITKPVDVAITLARLKTQVTIKTLMDEREQTIKHLEAAEVMRERLFRVASHDLKNPLANVRMAEYVLRESVAHDPVATQMMETVTASLDSMQEVIEDFLNVVVLQNGRVDVNLSHVEVEQIIYNVVLQYNMSAEKKNIALKVHDVQSQVLADSSRLAQVLGNLISNAIKYSPPGSTVHIWTDASQGNVRINVADNGPGIRAEERHLLYTEFGKLSPRPTGQETSTGLGLWIVKNLVEMMGGSVGADSRDEGGSIFWIELPAQVTEPFVVA